MSADYRYEAQWSDEDGEFVGLTTEFPSLSFLALTPDEALAGIKSLVADVLRDMARTGEAPPVPTAGG
ncbi:HicB family protein [Mycolicibacterium fortuitum]|uniref:HicB family protein n=1 Tax=Mycolicibacterium fortuitum TaxID=1766 RepID=A0A378UB48_MYCFO|nr:HicB family protein [Mycolicibacterium fortuitum]